MAMAADGLRGMEDFGSHFLALSFSLLPAKRLDGPGFSCCFLFFCLHQQQQPMHPLSQLGFTEPAGQEKTTTDKNPPGVVGENSWRQLCVWFYVSRSI
jgi:hypothetical protein